MAQLIAVFLPVEYYGTTHKVELRRRRWKIRVWGKTLKIPLRRRSKTIRYYKESEQRRIPFTADSPQEAYRAARDLTPEGTRLNRILWDSNVADLQHYRIVKLLARLDVPLARLLARNTSPSSRLWHEESGWNTKRCARVFPPAT